MKHNKISKIVMAIAAFALVGSLQSCTKALQGLKFNLGMQTQTVTVTIPATPAGTVSIGPVSTEYNVDSFVRAQTGNQLGISNISSVKLSTVELKLSGATSANNFGNFQSFSGSFYSDANSAPYALSISNNPSAYSDVLDLPVNADDEMKSYIGTHFTYNFTGTLRTPVTVPLTCTITFTYQLIVQG